jgi:hypothetical protein
MITLNGKKATNPARPALLVDEEEEETPVPIYLSSTVLQDDDSLMERPDITKYIDEKVWITSKRKIPNDVIKKVLAYISLGEEPRGYTQFDAKVKLYYDRAIRSIECNTMVKFFAPEGMKFSPAPSMVKDQRDCIMVPGPSGVGKTTWGLLYALAYKATYPKNRILYFSLKSSDKKVDEYTFIERVPLEEWRRYTGELSSNHADKKRKKSDDNMEEDNDICERMSIDELANTLIWTDDFENADPQVVKEMNAFIKYCSQLGRDRNINLIVCIHQGFDSHKTRDLILESNMIVWFPSSGTNNHMVRYMKEFATLDNRQIQKVTNMTSRWAVIYLRHPVCIISESEMWLPKAIKEITYE